MTNLNTLPDDLPVPDDDGQAAHLLGQELPSISLRSTNGALLDLADLRGLTVIYAYPMTGKPGTDLPKDWNLIPGARGCTPQACSYRDHFAELQALNASLYGLSTQSSDYQKEMAERLHLPFDVLSDEQFKLTSALSLPNFQVDGMTLLKRLTLICQNRKIIRVHYPVFPPDKDIDHVIAFLKTGR